MSKGSKLFQKGVIKKKIEEAKGWVEEYSEYLTCGYPDIVKSAKLGVEYWQERVDILTPFL